MARDKRVMVLGATGVIALVIWLVALVPARPVMQVTFFDVGDGQCTLIRTPSGRTLIVDCGTSSWRDSSSLGGKLIVPYLQGQGQNHIDALVLSHRHLDHVSGVIGLLKSEPADLVMDAGADESAAIRGAIRACHGRYRKLRQGQTIDMGDGVVATVIGPSGADYADTNDQSIVLRVTFGRAAILLEADAGAEAEADMLASGAKLGSQVLQVGHHGSARSSSPQWLAAVKPIIAVIPCSSRSRYGFPSGAVLDRLASCGARTYTTGRSGAVTISTDGASIRVNTFRPTR